MRKMEMYEISINDRGLMAVCQNMLCRDNPLLHDKIEVAIRAFDATNLHNSASYEEFNMLRNGAALMFQLMTNPEFLKEHLPK